MTQPYLKSLYLLDPYSKAKYDTIGKIADTQTSLLDPYSKAKYDTIIFIQEKTIFGYLSLA